METIMEKVKYSFVLPAYKAKYLKEAIQSILDQTYTDFELIIVNDASPENLDEIVASFDDKRLTYYKNEKNLGGTDLVAQWNHSISYAAGDYLILASDDDTYSPMYLEKMDAMACKYPNINVFRPRVKRIDKNRKIIGIDGFISEYLSKLEYLYLWSTCAIGSGVPFFMFKREALMAIGGFVNYPLAWFSDDATVLELADAGIVTCNEVLFSFRLANESIRTADNNKATLRAKYRATRMFVNDHLEYINSYVPKDSEEEYLLKCIKKYFPRIIRRNKVQSQLRTASFRAILGTLDEGRKIKGINTMSLILGCRYPIRRKIRKYLIPKT